MSSPRDAFRENGGRLSENVFRKFLPGVLDPSWHFHTPLQTMAGGGKGEPVRVLAIFGSESGTAKAAIKGLCASLGKDSDLQIVDIKEGNSVGALETLKEKCAAHVRSAVLLAAQLGAL